MRPVAQRIEDPHFEAAQPGDAFGGQVVEVTGIGEVAEAEAERTDVAVALQERERPDRAALPLDRYSLAGAETVFGHDRRVFAAGWRFETITEAPVQNLGGAIIEKDINLPLAERLKKVS